MDEAERIGRWLFNAFERFWRDRRPPPEPGVSVAPTEQDVIDFTAAVTRHLDAFKAEVNRIRPWEERPCCAFLNVDNVIYKGVYLPGREEFAAHGYKPELYDAFMESWKENIDKHGSP